MSEPSQANVEHHGHHKHRDHHDHQDKDAEKVIGDVKDAVKDVRNQCSDSCLCKHPEKIEKYLDDHSKIVEDVQAMLFWKRPVPMAIILVSSNLFLLFLKLSRMSFLPTFFLLMAMYRFFLLARTHARDAINTMFFPKLNSHEKDAPNRIRTTKEVSKFIHHVCVVSCRTRAVLMPTFTGNFVHDYIIPLGASFALFIIFSITGTYFVVATLLNSVLLLPGIILHPAVYKYLQPAIDKACEMFLKTGEKAREIERNVKTSAN